MADKTRTESDFARHKVVEAQEFRLVGEDGKRLATIGTHYDGGVAVSMARADGSLGAYIALTRRGTLDILVNMRGDRRRIALSLGNDEMQPVRNGELAGTAHAVIDLAPDGSPRLTLIGKDQSAQWQAPRP